MDFEKERKAEQKQTPFLELRVYNPGGLLAVLVAAALAIYSLGTFLTRTEIQPPSSAGAFDHLRAHCAHIPPIQRDEFLARQTALAKSLHALNASAYIAEPGASAGFFGNISGSAWHLSERPLLLLVAPDVDSDGTVRAHVSVLTPSFEETRARMLPVPAANDVRWVAWAEEADPYARALDGLPTAVRGSEGKIYVDGSIRNFIVDGLSKASNGAKVLTAPTEIKHLRERKSSTELNILKCVNEVTVLAIRAVRKELHIGIRESEGKTLIRSALGAAGLTDLDSLVLFGENAALPHGSGTDRLLGKHDFALFDCGGALHGYHSDVTRTFALRDSDISSKHLAIWELVHSAQDAAARAARNGTIAQTVDAAARKVISDAGYGQYFTHRLGHGIGLEVHEEPYLRGGARHVLATGHSFSNEPGVYIEGKVGVRLEDCFYVAENGESVFLTAGIGGQATSPWKP